MENKPKFEPIKIADLAPSLTGLFSARDIEFLTQKKSSRTETRTNTKILEPFTPAEMKLCLQALSSTSHHTPARRAASTSKKNWNSSVKVMNVEKRVNEGKIKNSTVRKVLNFQPKVVPNPRKTLIQSETPQFQKPAVSRVKKSVHTLAKTSIKISGINRIPKTPETTNKNRKTMVNKENNSYLANFPKKPLITPKSILRKQAIPDTPLSNISFKSNDASFLQTEKEINDIEERKILEQEELNKVDKETPPVSTPFKEYRNVQEFFNNSDVLVENDSLYNDNTIMSFSNSNQNGKRDESVIVSLCDLLQKTTVTNTDNIKSEFELLQLKQELEQNKARLDSVIDVAMKSKESVLKSLEVINRLLEKQDINDICTKSNSLPVTKKMVPEIKTKQRCSVIKSPSYKIPKKPCLQKKVYHKSLPNISATHSPEVMDSKALNIYMGMKKNMKFLNTPKVKSRCNDSTDTPARMSKNLQSQLDKLYNDS